MRRSRFSPAIPAPFALKAKLNFKFDATISRCLSSAASKTETTGKRDRLTEKRRAQISDGRGFVCAVKKIADLDGKFQIIWFFIIIIALLSAAAIGTIYTAPTAASATLSLLRRSIFFSSASKAEFFRSSQIDDKKFASSAVIARNDHIARVRCRVKRAESGYDNSGFGKIRRKRRTLGEKRIAVCVRSRSDIKRRAGAKRDKRTEAHAPKSFKISADDKAVASVERGVAVFAA